MTEISPKPVSARAGVIPGQPIGRGALIFVAWLATLLLSNLPLVIARDVLGGDIPWITPAWIGLAVLLFATSYAWPILRPLRGYFLVMGVIVFMTFWVNPFVLGSTFWHNLTANQSPPVTFLGTRALLAIQALIVISGLLLIGVKRQDAFLAVGNLKAPVGGQASSTRRRFLTWPVFGTTMVILLGGLYFAFLTSQTPGGLSKIASALPWLPLILLSAGLNAFSEEVMYRAAPLGALLPAVGPGHAIWLTSLWFGLGHYYGGFPSGPVGLVQVGLLALLLGKAMLDTRGLGWSWIIHVTIDTVIFIFLT